MEATLEGIGYNKIIIDLSDQEYQALLRACADKGITPLDMIVSHIEHLISQEGHKNED